jgi:hypothetical protein
MFVRLTLSICLVLALHWNALAQGSRDSLPPTNARVLAFVEQHIGKRVDRGECWDLAAKALNLADAQWDGDMGFGRLIDPSKEAVLPGDIIQLEGVEFRWTEDNAINAITMPHHTAIVYEVVAPGRFTIAHQNMEGIGRKVGLGELVLDRRVKGRILIYRPLAR